MFVLSCDKAINIDQIISMRQSGFFIEFEASNGFGTHLEFESEEKAHSAYVDILAGLMNNATVVNLPGSPILRD